MARERKRPPAHHRAATYVLDAKSINGIGYPGWDHIYQAWLAGYRAAKRERRKR